MRVINISAPTYQRTPTDLLNLLYFTLYCYRTYSSSLLVSFVGREKGGVGRGLGAPSSRGPGEINENPSSMGPDEALVGATPSSPDLLGPVPCLKLY